MGRNRGFAAALIQIQREAKRQPRAEVAAATMAARDAERLRTHAHVQRTCLIPQTDQCARLANWL
jgi:hypothetical protein